MASIVKDGEVVFEDPVHNFISSDVTRLKGIPKFVMGIEIPTDDGFR